MRDSKHIVIGVAGFILLGSSFAERAVAVVAVLSDPHA